jgi:hypothetical protein
MKKQFNMNRQALNLVKWTKWSKRMMPKLGVNIVCLNLFIYSGLLFSIASYVAVILSAFCKLGW